MREQRTIILGGTKLSKKLLIAIRENIVLRPRPAKWTALKLKTKAIDIHAVRHLKSRRMPAAHPLEPP
jgi:hypothetical protein